MRHKRIIQSQPELEDLELINKKERIHIVNFTIPMDHRVKMKESKMLDKYLDHTRELKKPWNMKVMVIPITFGMVHKVLEKILKEYETNDRIETILITEQLRLSRILSGVLET